MTDRVFTLTLISRKVSLSLDKVSKMFEYLLVANSLEAIPGDLYFDHSKVLSNKLLDQIIQYNQTENEPTHISGSQVDHVCVKSALLEEFHTNAIVQNISFSDQDAVRVVFWKN